MSFILYKFAAKHYVYGISNRSISSKPMTLFWSLIYQSKPLISKLIPEYLSLFMNKRGLSCLTDSAVSESRLSNPSPSHHFKVRVRVITSESESESASPNKKKHRVRVTNLVVHIFNFCLSSKPWKQTTKCQSNVRECQSKQRNTARPLLLGLGRDSSPSHESRFLSPSPSPSQSEQSGLESESEKNGIESESLLESHSTANWIQRHNPVNPDTFKSCVILNTSGYQKWKLNSSLRRWRLSFCSER